MCWRHKPTDRKHGEMSLNTLKQGLHKVNSEFFRLRLEARTRLEYNQYWTKMEKLGERSKHIRSEEQKRIHKKEVNLRK